jgi:hypothetical protein
MTGSTWQSTDAHFMVARKQREVRKEPGTRCNLQRHASSDLIPPARAYLLKFPPHPKIVPPAGDQVFNT